MGLRANKDSKFFRNHWIIANARDNLKNFEKHKWREEGVREYSFTSGSQKAHFVAKQPLTMIWISNNALLIPKVPPWLKKMPFVSTNQHSVIFSGRYVVKVLMPDLPFAMKKAYEQLNCLPFNCISQVNHARKIRHTSSMFTWICYINCNKPLPKNSKRDDVLS